MSVGELILSGLRRAGGRSVVPDDYSKDELQQLIGATHRDFLWPTSVETDRTDGWRFRPPFVSAGLRKWWGELARLDEAETRRLRNLREYMYESLRDQGLITYSEEIRKNSPIYVAPPANQSQPYKRVVALELWHRYSRKDVHTIFEPDSTFTPQAGTWGLQGIIALSDSPGDFVLFVTYGTQQGNHNFEEEISGDGVLTWQSQPRQTLSSPRIRQFIDHDDLTSSIHLFLRTSVGFEYTYFGTLGYLDHDPTREQPVHFTWQLMDWPAPSEVLSELGIVPSESSTPASRPADQRDSLVESLPPSRRVRSAAGGRAVPIHAGQDARNHDLGVAGEKLAIKYERTRLTDGGRPDLAERINHVSIIEGDAAGYDIHSFDIDGSDRHVEVKTTAGAASRAFFLSPNELKFSISHPHSYVLLRIYAYSWASNSGRFYQQLGPVSDNFELVPSEYRVRILP